MSLIAELKRRNVFRVGVAYVLIAWVLLQAADFALDLIDAPNWAIQMLAVMAAIGLPGVLIFSWVFEMTPEGLRRESEVDRSESITPMTGRKLDRVILAALAVAVIYLLLDKSVLRERVDRQPEVITAAEPAPTTAEATPPAREPERLAAEAGPKSIAVLPFANRSRLEDDEFFTDGIHDDLLTQLAKVRDLKVVSRTSVMKYKGTEKSIGEIASELEVATILEGGVQRAGKRIRINAQLIDVGGDQHLWAETFDREMTVENIFDIQSEITRQIVQAVRGELTEDEQLKLARVPTNNLEAYEAYLQALALTNRADYSQQNYIEAEFWLDQAVGLDPGFAQAWALLVEIHGQAVWIGYDASPQRMDAAQMALDRARELAPELPETIAAEAEFEYRIKQDFPGATELFKAAHQALPGDVDILHRLAVAQRRTPDVQGALDSFQLAMELDANHSRSASTMVETLLYMDELERAEAVIDRWILRFPDARDLRAHRATLHLGHGDVETALSLFENMSPWVGSAFFSLATNIHFFERNYPGAIAVWDIPEVAEPAENRGAIGTRELYRAWAYHLMGDRDRSLSEARRGIELITTAAPTESYSDAFELATLATIYALVGTREEALATIDRASAMLPVGGDQLFGSIMAQGRALVLAMAGEREAALDEIERQLQGPYRFNKWLLHLDPRWDFFRDDERFNRLVAPEEKNEF